MDLIKKLKEDFYEVCNQWSDPFEDEDGSDKTWSKFVSESLKQLGETITQLENEYKQEPKEKIPDSQYGEWCPTCKFPIVAVTRGIPSIGTCSSGHKIDRRNALRRNPGVI